MGEAIARSSDVYTQIMNVNNAIVRVPVSGNQNDALHHTLEPGQTVGIIELLVSSIHWKKYIPSIMPITKE